MWVCEVYLGGEAMTQTKRDELVELIGDYFMRHDGKYGTLADEFLSWHEKQKLPLLKACKKTYKMMSEWAELGPEEQILYDELCQAIKETVEK